MLRISGPHAGTHWWPSYLPDDRQSTFFLDTSAPPTDSCQLLCRAFTETNAPASRRIYYDAPLFLQFELMTLCSHQRIFAQTRFNQASLWKNGDVLDPYVLKNADKIMAPALK